jgi:cyclohexanecarboxylate-CoA ligase/acyl-CoA synthetase
MPPATPSELPILGLGDQARGDQYRASGYWHDKALTDYLDEAVAEAPDHLCITDGVRSLTYRDVQGEAYRLAATLRTLGVRTGERVAVQLPNWAEFTIAYLALARIGAVLVPIMPIYRSNEVEYVLQNSGAVVVITAGSFRKFDYQQMYAELRATCPDLRQVVIVRGTVGTEGSLAYEELARPGATDLPDGALLGSPAAPDAPHVIVYTSGTESRPKGCCHTWYTIGFSVRGLAREVLRMTPDDVMFMPSPITHSTGLVIGIGVPLVARASAHLMDVWDPEDALRRIKEFGCTVTATATPFVRMLLDTLDPDLHDVSSMRAWLCAGAPIPSAMVAEAAERLPDCRLLPVWGCSEVMAGTTCRLEDPLEATEHSDGRAAVTGVEIKVVTFGGVEAKLGEEGELLYRGPGRMIGYWGDPQRTDTAIDADGWYHTSDLARMSEGGYVRISGRSKDIIIRGGTNISAREVEDLLITHPKVNAAAAVAVPDERLGERMFLFVVAADPAAVPTLGELVDFLRNDKKIANHKLPEGFALIDALPLTATGKIQKFQLRQLARELSERQRAESR